MKSRLAIVDARCEETIIQRLSDFAEQTLPFRSEGITYDSISCHPDIFLYQEKQRVVVAPNAPQILTQTLQTLNIDFLVGKGEIGTQLHNSCLYNCVATDRHLFHRTGFTDERILQLNSTKQFVALPQSYTRCSMLALDNDHFITSDAGIDKQLKANGFHTFLFDPSAIRIAVHKNGFLGGTCGRHEDKILFLGNPLAHADGKDLCHFIEKIGLEVVSLANGPLYDGGGIFFL